MGDEPIRVPGVTGSRDENGIITIIKPHWCKTIEETMTIGEATLLGLPEKTREFSGVEADTDKPGFIVNITYEGADEDEEENTFTYEFDSSFAEEPIETFPDIDELKRLFGGTVDSDGRLKFPEKLPGNGTLTSAPTSGLNAGKTITTDKNPMFGLETFLVTRAIFRRTRTTTRLPSDALDNVGKLVKKIPQPFAALTPSDRDWLIMPPSVSQRGNTFLYSEEWMLSAPGGWPPAIYKLISGGSQTKGESDPFPRLTAAFGPEEGSGS